MPENPPASSAYWAIFERRGDDLFRFDTRIYGEATDRPRHGDRPLGCVIGKNPGSALPRHWEPGVLLPIALGGDRFLPTVRAVVRKAHAAAGVTWPSGQYVQVLNLFYLCNRDLRQARERLAQLRDAPRCPAERRRLAWAWFLWGGPDTHLDPLKERFRRRPWQASLFVDGTGHVIRDRAPYPAEPARHTQGMRHDAPVAAFASLVRAQRSRRCP